MARAKGAAKAAPKRKGAGTGSPEDRLIDAALALAARQGWRQTSLGAIAAEAGLSLAEAYALHRSKAGILLAFIRRVDRTVLDGAEAGEGSETSRERLFDTMMRRYDALKPHREAVRAILREGFGTPAMLLGGRRVALSMRWMMEASGVSPQGCAGRLVKHGLVALHLSVLRVFLDDDSDDLAKTMAALDRGLKRGEAWCRYLPHRRGPAAAEARTA